MRTLRGLTNTITGILLEQKGIKNEHETAKYIIQYLFEEDNLVVPPKQDFDLRQKMFDDFYEWFKSKNLTELEENHFEIWLNSL